MNGKAFLDFAAEVEGSEWPPAVEQAMLRTVINRAYYAVFWEARATLEARGIFVGVGRSAHQQLIDHFETLTGPTVTEYRAIAAALHSLKTDRNAADYEEGTTFSRNDATFALTQARRLFAMLRTCR